MIYLGIVFNTSEILRALHKSQDFVLNPAARRLLFYLCTKNDNNRCRHLCPI